eukprot:2232401-Prymnesium_polylepis.1
MPSRGRAAASPRRQQQASRPRRRDRNCQRTWRAHRYRPSVGPAHAPTREQSAASSVRQRYLAA